MPRPLSEAAREKALAATQTLVAECGIDGFTMDGVAKLSGVAKTTLYRHWSSGDELLMQAIDCQVERFPSPDTGTLRGDLTELIGMVSSVAHQDGNRQMMLDLVSEAARNPDFAAVHRAMIDERHKPIIDLVTRAVERGEIPETDVDAACRLVEGSLMARIILNGEPLEPDEIPMLVEFVARGLGSPSTD